MTQSPGQECLAPSINTISGYFGDRTLGHIRSSDFNGSAGKNSVISCIFFSLVERYKWIVESCETSMMVKMTFETEKKIEHWILTESIRSLESYKFWRATLICSVCGETNKSTVEIRVIMSWYGSPSIIEQNHDIFLSLICRAYAA